MNTILKCNFSFDAENSDQVNAIVSKLNNDKLRTFNSPSNTQISLELAVETIDELQQNLLQIGPALTELNKLAKPSELHCAGDVPEPLKASLAPFQPKFITIQQYQTLFH